MQPALAMQEKNAYFLLGSCVRRTMLAKIACDYLPWPGE